MQPSDGIISVVRLAGGDSDVVQIGQRQSGDPVVATYGIYDATGKISEVIRV
jgi:hypothetical protein